MGFLDSLSEIGGEQLGEGRVVVGVDSGPLKRGLDNVSETIQHKASGWGAAFKVASIGVGALATAFIGFAIEGTKKADELDASIGRIAAQAGLATGEAAKLRSGLLEMSTRTKQPVDELAKSIEAVVKAGFSVDDALRIQEQSARAATVTNADLGSVTNTVVTAMKAWNIAGKDVNKVTDTLLTTVGRSRIDWDSLSRIIATAAPIAKDAGVSFGDLNAAIIAVGRSGLPARRAAAGVIALIRAMSSPTAQKEMKLLGITVDATTIAHDGLLATLEKIEKASGKHVSVLVRNKKGEIDYAKSVAATEKANRGSLQAMQAMLGGASGLVTADILLANGAKDYKDGQDALNKSLGQTTKEFEKVKEADLSVQMALIRNEITKFAIDLGTNLLPYAAKFLTWLAVAVPKALRGIGDLWTNTLSGPVTAMVDSFLQFAQALGNALFNWNTGGAANTRGSITDFFGGLATVVADLARDIGGVFDFLKNLLNLPFAGPLIKMTAFLGVVRTLASLSGTLVRSLTSKALGTLNFLTGGVFKLTGPSALATGPLDAAARATTDAALKTEAAARATSEAATKTGDAASESAGKLGEAATKLSESGAAMAEWAKGGTILAEGAVVGGAESINAAEAIRQNTYTESTIAANEATVEAAKATKAADKTTVEANDSTVQTNTQQQVQLQTDKVVSDAQMGAAKATTEGFAAMTAATEEGEAARTAAVEAGMAAQTAAIKELVLFEETAGAEANLGGLRGGNLFAGAESGAGVGSLPGKLLGGAGKLIGFAVSKAIVPVLVAQLVGDIAKAPVGDFVSNSLGMKEAGAKIKEDFFGGMLDLVSSVFAGTDAWVGHAAVTTIGNAHISTMDLAKLGITSAQIDELQSKDPKVSLPAQLDQVINQQGLLARKTNETVADWFTRLQTFLGEAASDNISAAIAAANVSPEQGPKYDAVVEPLLRSALATYFDEQFKSLGTSFTSVVGGILTDRGFTPGAASQLTTEQSALITRLSAAGAEKYGFLLDFVTKKALGEIGGKLTAPSATALGLGPELTSGFDPSVAIAQQAEVLRKNVASARQQFADAMAALPAGQADAIKDAMKQFAAQTTNIDPGVQQALARKFGADWQIALKDGTEQFSPPPDKALSAKLTKVLGKNWSTILLSIGEGTATNADTVAIEHKMKKAFGANWKAIFAGAVSGVTDTATVKELTRLFGPDWRSALGQFGTLLWQSEGGKDRDILVASLQTYADNLASTLSGTDFGAPRPRRPGQKPVSLTPAQEQANRDAVSAAVAKSIKDGTLLATASPDALQAKAAVQKLGEDWAKAIPDAAARDRFITAMAAQAKLNATPLQSNIYDVLPTLPSHLDDLTAALHRFDSELSLTLQNLPSGGPSTRPITHDPTETNSSGAKGSGGSEDTRPSNPPPPTGPTRLAGGGVFDVNSVSHADFGGLRATIGEAGREEVAVVSHPRTINWSDLTSIGGGSEPSLPGGLSRGKQRGRGGPSQVLNVDHLHVQSRADEQAILDTLEFMSPGGIS